MYLERDRIRDPALRLQAQKISRADRADVLRVVRVRLYFDRRFSRRESFNREHGDTSRAVRGDTLRGGFDRITRDLLPPLLHI